MYENFSNLVAPLFVAYIIISLFATPCIIAYVLYKVYTRFIQGKKGR